MFGSAAVCVWRARAEYKSFKFLSLWNSCKQSYPYRLKPLMTLRLNVVTGSTPIWTIRQWMVGYGAMRPRQENMGSYPRLMPDHRLWQACSTSWTAVLVMKMYDYEVISLEKSISKNNISLSNNWIQTIRTGRGAPLSAGLIGYVTRSPAMTRPMSVASFL